MAFTSPEKTSADDRSLVVYARWDARTRQTLRATIDDDLLAEHQARPLGQHSDRLERVLNYFRRGPQARKYVIVCTRAWEEWRIGVLSGQRGVPPTVLDDERFNSEAAALHGVFLRRVRDLMQA
jgi:branched-chain amino acid transport system permease protein